MNFEFSRESLVETMRLGMGFTNVLRVMTEHVF